MKPYQRSYHARLRPDFRDDDPRDQFDDARDRNPVRSHGHHGHQEIRV